MDPNYLKAQIDAAAHAALAELQSLSIDDVQRATAITWAGRAVAAYALFEQTGNIYRLLDAEEYGHEAIEHAALAGSIVFIEGIRRRIGAAKAHAIKE